MRSYIIILSACLIFISCKNSQQESTSESFPQQETKSADTSFHDKKVKSESISDKIKVEQPLPRTEITSPLKINGKARGNWFFEATAPVQILDKDGNELGESFIKTDADWMTTDFVDFSGTIKFDAPNDEKGYLVFWRANPSDKSENDEFYKLPVIFPPKK